MVITPVVPITVRPVVIVSISYVSSYVVISKEEDELDVEGFWRYYNLNAIRPPLGTES